MIDIKILVVDDSSTIRRIITKALIELDVQENNITQAVDGLDALGKIRSTNHYDLILTDWNMPKMDGLALVHTLRSIPKSKQIPIVMITTEGSKKEVIEALKSGVNNYIVKPFTLEDLTIKLLPIIAKFDR